MRILIVFFVLAFAASLSNAQWVQTNGPYGGTVRCFAVSGTNLFAGTSDGEVFLSANNGTSWTAVDSGLASNQKGGKLEKAVRPDRYPRLLVCAT